MVYWNMMWMSQLYGWEMIWVWSIETLCGCGIYITRFWCNQTLYGVLKPYKGKMDVLRHDVYHKSIDTWSVYCVYKNDLKEFMFLAKQIIVLLCIGQLYILFQNLTRTTLASHIICHLVKFFKELGMHLANTPSIAPMFRQMMMVVQMMHHMMILKWVVLLW